MDEAETLCDRIAVIDAGRVVALDTPARLTRRAGQAQQVRFTAPADFTSRWLAGVAGVERIDHDGGTVVVTGSGPLLARVATALAAHDAAPDDLTVQRTSLEDAFLALTGPHTRPPTS
jgi:ABC-2 type transport system ATP-binding protein